MKFDSIGGVFLDSTYKCDFSKHNQIQFAQSTQSVFDL